MKPARRAESEELARRFFEAAAGGDTDALPGMRCLMWRDCQVRYARAPARDFTGATARVKRDPDAIDHSMHHPYQRPGRGQSPPAPGMPAAAAVPKGA